MTLREDIGPVRAAVRYGRHSRPRPVGGRFRLPTIRFSGAAVAMSTVVGISIATTWLLSEQQGVGRRPGMSNVGASPPLPSPDTAQPAPAAATASSRHTTAESRPRASAVPAADRGARPSAGPSGASGSPSGSPSPGTPGPSGSPGGAPAATPVAADPVGPAPIAPKPPTADPVAKQPAVTDPLSGRAVLELIGPTGTRHTVDLTVREELTALQVELRLARPDVLPGTTPASTLPGVVTTVSQEHGTLVYRFTLPAGLGLAPGRYTFEVYGSRPPAPPAPSAPSASATPSAGAGKAPAAVHETWSAAAFVPHGSEPHAVAVRGSFG
ncbi:hypothetical protein KNE206_34860 [Kitasatospora sp. NE20-6]|uniref:hypothetical protein n=1 Tax=Kitasatospora sp. NE20-6 TaxID=2859066 RepID=UPI0034DC5E92